MPASHQGVWAGIPYLLRMKILLTSIGTRGDMEPFLALGELLKKAGHKTICLMPEQFRPLAEEDGPDFETLGPEFMEMLESGLGKLALGGSGTALQKFAYRHGAGEPAHQPPGPRPVHPARGESGYRKPMI